MLKLKQSRVLTITALLAVVYFCGLANITAQPSRKVVLDAMRQATTFMTTRVAYRGGYVWAVSEDFKRRYGEVPARPTPPPLPRSRISRVRARASGMASMSMVCVTPHFCATSRRRAGAPSTIT